MQSLLTNNCRELPSAKPEFKTCGLLRRAGKLQNKVNRYAGGHTGSRVDARFEIFGSHETAVGYYLSVCIINYQFNLRIRLDKFGMIDDSGVDQDGIPVTRVRPYVPVHQLDGRQVAKTNQITLQPFTELFSPGR